MLAGSCARRSSFSRLRRTDPPHQTSPRLILPALAPWPAAQDYHPELLAASPPHSRPALLRRTYRSRSRRYEISGPKVLAMRARRPEADLIAASRLPGVTAPRPLPLPGCERRDHPRTRSAPQLRSGASPCLAGASPGLTPATLAPSAELPAVRAIYSPLSDIEGGRASGVLAQPGFGRGPMTSTSLPPPAISAWSNQALFQGLPFRVAD